MKIKFMKKSHNQGLFFYVQIYFYHIINRNNVIGGVIVFMNIRNKTDVYNKIVRDLKEMPVISDIVLKKETDFKYQALHFQIMQN